MVLLFGGEWDTFYRLFGNYKKGRKTRSGSTSNSSSSLCIQHMYIPLFLHFFTFPIRPAYRATFRDSWTQWLRNSRRSSLAGTPQRQSEKRRLWISSERPRLGKPYKGASINDVHENFGFLGTLPPLSHT